MSWAFLGSLFYFLFVYFLGVVSVVVGIFYLGNQLQTKNDPSANAREVLLNDAASSQQQRPPTGEKAGWLQFRSEREGSTKGMIKSHYVVLKANMMFLFDEEKATSPASVILLDGCSVTTIKKRKDKPRWHKRTLIQLQHAHKSLFWEQQTVYIAFQLAKEVEEWYYALEEASTLTSKKDAATVELRRRQKEYFAMLSNRFRAPGYPLNPVQADWFNAIISRVFWNVHDQSYFLSLIKTKLSEKISRIKKPQFVEEIRLKDMVFGTHLPRFKNVQLTDVTEKGAVIVDCDVEYAPAPKADGFKLIIEILLKFSISVSFSVTLQSLAGQARIHISAPDSETFWMAFHREPECAINIDTHFGGSYTLLNIPSVTAVVVDRLKTKLIKVMVLPVMDDWPLPERQRGDQSDQQSTSSAAATASASSSSSSSGLTPSSSRPLSQQLSASTSGSIPSIGNIGSSTSPPVPRKERGEGGPQLSNSSGGVQHSVSTPVVTSASIPILSAAVAQSPRKTSHTPPTTDLSSLLSLPVPIPVASTSPQSTPSSSSVPNSTIISGKRG